MVVVNDNALCMSRQLVMHWLLAAREPPVQLPQYRCDVFTRRVAAALSSIALSYGIDRLAEFRFVTMHAFDKRTDRQTLTARAKRLPLT